MPKKRALEEELVKALVLGTKRLAHQDLRLAGASSESGDSLDGTLFNPMTTIGDIIYGEESGAPVRRAIGVENQVLTVVDVGAGVLKPAWVTVAAGYTDEQAQDAIGAILIDTASVVLVYDDTLNQITASVILEWLQDTVAAILTGGTHTNLTATYQDAGGVIDLAVTSGSYASENARDDIGAALVAGANITITIDDALDTITIAASGGSYSAENARDDIGVALVAGDNIDIAIDDVLDTITITVEALTSADLTDFAEAVDDRVATFIVAGNNIDAVYDDVANTLTIAVESLTSVDIGDFAEAVDDRVATFIVAGNNVDVIYDDAANTLTIHVEALTQSDIDSLVADLATLSAASHAAATILDSANIDFGISGQQITADLTIAAKTTTTNFIIDGGGSAITTGIKGDIGFEFACHIMAWKLVSTGVSGALVLDLWNDSYTNFPATVADSICGAEKPTITATSDKGEDTSLAAGVGWAIAANSILRVNADSCASITKATLVLKIVRD